MHDTHVQLRRFQSSVHQNCVASSRRDRQSVLACMASVVCATSRFAAPAVDSFFCFSTTRTQTMSQVSIVSKFAALHGNSDRLMFHGAKTPLLRLELTNAGRSGRVKGRSVLPYMRITHIADTYSMLSHASPSRVGCRASKWNLAVVRYAVQTVARKTQKDDGSFKHDCACRCSGVDGHRHPTVNSDPKYFALPMNLLCLVWFTSSSSVHPDHTP